MGFSLQLVIESKFFSLARDGRYLCITEKSRRFVKEIVLGMSMVFWLAKALEVALKEIVYFYAPQWEGDRGFLALKFFNAYGHYMEVLEYGGGGCRKFIFISEERDG